MTSLDVAAPASYPSRRLLIGLLLSQTILFFVPMVVLGQAIGWPGSLRLPPADALPLIADHAAALQVGYWAYLLTSLGFVPLAISLRAYAESHGVRGGVVDTAAALGVAAGILKTLGIVRWLLVMPTLATAYRDATDPATRTAIEISYLTLNGYAGAVGELLGVQLVSGIWFLLTGLVLRRLGRRLLGAAALGIGCLFLATCVRTVMPDIAALQSVAVPLALLWFPAAALSVWRYR